MNAIELNTNFNLNNDELLFDLDGAVLRVVGHEQMAEMDDCDELEVVAVNENNALILVSGELPNANFDEILDQCENILNEMFE